MEIKLSKDFCTLEKDEHGIYTLTIKDTRGMNLLSSLSIADLLSSISDVARSPDCQLLILTGSGKKAFIGGADINELATLDPKTARDFISSLHDLCEAIRNLEVPVIARINGWTLGGGLEVAAACDLRVACSSSMFGMPEVRVGIPSVIHAALLPRLIGSGRTRLMTLTGNPVDAQTALQWGLIDVLAEDDDLDQAVKQVADAICVSGQEVIKLQKRLLNVWDEVQLSVATRTSIASFSEAYKCCNPEYYMLKFLEAKSRSRTLA